MADSALKPLVSRPRLPARETSGGAASRLVIQKFGGTSVGNPERIRKVADRIAAAHARGDSLVVVVSAMGDTTDELIELAHQVSQTPSHREMDMLLTAGERISMALLSMALADRGVGAVSFTGSQTGVITDASHRRARILRIRGDRVREALEAGKVVIVAGFQGVSEAKEVTTLGRGGSDTSAVGLSVTLGADVCEIYTDVDGIFSADPRVVPHARFWPRIPAHLMEEMAVLGAGVLHSRCIQIARANGIPIWVKNSMRDVPPEGDTSMESSKHGSGSGGTEVFPAMRDASTLGMEEYRVTGVTSDSSKALVTVEFMRPTVSGAIWDLATQLHLAIVAPTLAEGKLRFFAAKESSGEWRKLLGRLVADGFLKEFQFDENYVPLSIVGDRFAQDGAALSRVFDRLAQERIEVTIASSSSTTLTVAVPAHRAEDGVRALHELFFEPSGGPSA